MTPTDPKNLPTWFKIDPVTRERLVKELEAIAPPPNFLAIKGENFVQDAAHAIGRHSVIVTLKQKLDGVPQ